MYSPPVCEVRFTREKAMNKTGKVAATLMVAGFMLAALSGCQKEGPAESAGKKMDAAVEKAADAVDDASAKAGEKIEEAGDKIKDATK
jgi:fructoselysine-6-P-deglycase FrlB-like protein